MSDSDRTAIMPRNTKPDFKKKEKKKEKKMLIPSMRLTADGAPATGPAHEIRMSPLAAILAEGEAGLTRSGPNEALPAEDVDGLVVQGLRAGPSLGVPDVEVDGHRCGGLRLGVDHPGTGGRNIVLA